MYAFNLTIHDSTGQAEVIVLNFRTEHTSPATAEAAVRAAVKNYLRSEDGKKDIKNNNGSFNWGDVAISIPESYYIREGLYPVRVNRSMDMEVEHDEDLAAELGL